MKPISFQTKLWLLVSVTWIALIAFGGVSAYQGRQTMLADRKAALDNLLDAAAHVIDAYKTKVAANEMTLAEAQQASLAELDRMRYGENGYVFAVTFEPATLLLNPARPQSVGQYVGDLRDAKGVYTFRALLDAARAGHGYVETRTPKPGQTEAAPKLSAVEKIDGWNWAVGTGAYIDDIEAEFEHVLLLTALGVMFAGALATTFAVLIIRSLDRQIGGDPEYVRGIALEIAQGNLRTTFATRACAPSSLLYSMRQMQTRLAGMIGAVQTSVAAIAEASGQIAAGNLDLSGRTEEQAAALEQTAASMEELMATVKQNTANVEEASSLASGALNLVNDGGRIVDSVVQTMTRVSEDAGRMADIIALIEGVAFQTNILALNAAVEAARAGEHGRGFAVVAGEVRALAQRSAAAAVDIKTLIESSSANVEASSKFVERAGDTMLNIQAAVEHVTKLMTDIAGASREQALGIEQVGQAVAQMDQVTQQNANLVVLAAQSSSALDNQTVELGHALAVFQVE